MKNFILILTALFTIACSDDKNAPQKFNYDTLLIIRVKDTKGNNLLETENYLEKDMKMFYVVNGVSKEVNNPQYDMPRNFVLNKETNPFELRVSPNDTDTEEFPVSFLQLNKTDTDTIKTHYRRGEGFIIIDKVWYNGKVVLDVANPADIGKGPIIEVVK